MTVLPTGKARPSPDKSSNRSVQPSTARHAQLHRFEQLGLRWNPFRVVRPDERADVFLPDLYRSTDSAEVIAKSRAPFTQIIADSGHGKSTLLAAVTDTLDDFDVAYEKYYLPPALFARVATPTGNVRVLVIDEVERLTHWNRYRLLRWTARGNRLIVSTHCDLSQTFAGSAVTVRIPEITDDGLQRYFQRRISWAGGDAERFRLTTAATAWLLRVTSGNLRVVEAVLYEVLQSAVPGEQLVIDVDQLAPHENFARQRTAVEALGNLPPTLWRRLRWAIRTRASY